MSDKRKILVIHALTLHSLPNVVVRDVELAASLKRFGDVVFANILALRHDQIQGHFDLTVITDSVMMRRSGSAWRYLSYQLRKISLRSKNVAVLVQDDYELPNRIVALARSANAVVYSSLALQLEQYQFSDLRVCYWPLTLVDPDIQIRLEKLRVPWDERKFDIVSRVNRTSIRFGLEGRRKADFSQSIAETARLYSLEVDISDKRGDRIAGDAWWQFLAESRFTVSRQGGASRIMKRPRHIVFAEAIEKVFEHSSIETQLKILDWVSSETKPLLALSPRFMEAAGLGVVQIIEETAVTHEMTPWEHYLPVAEDGRNLNDVLKFVQSKQATDMADRCHRLFFQSNQFSHDRWYGQMAGNAGLQHCTPGVVSILKLEDDLNQSLIRFRSNPPLKLQAIPARELRNIFRRYDCPSSALMFPWISVDVSRINEGQK